MRRTLRIARLEGHVQGRVQALDKMGVQSLGKPFDYMPLFFIDHFAEFNILLPSFYLPFATASLID